MSSIESLQRIYTSCTPDLQHVDYWTRLRWFKLSSIERRLQRYRIIYIWKILNNLVVNPGIKYTNSEHCGLMVNIDYKKCADSWSHKLWDQSLKIHGGKLFNCLPPEIRSYMGLTDADISISSRISGFKSLLDKFLEKIPDCPLTQDLYPDPINPITGRNSNCIIDWVKHLKINTRRPSIVDM